MENIGDEIVKMATRMRFSCHALNQITGFCEICFQFCFFVCHITFPPLKSTVFCDEKPMCLIQGSD